MAVPSKLTSYFSSGKPILAATDSAGFTAGELAASGAGVCVPAGRPDLLLSEALRLATDRVLAAQLGEAGRRYCDARCRRRRHWIATNGGSSISRTCVGGVTGATMVKRALITGITGQDGSYLAEFLLNKGYEVHGIIRRASTFNTRRIDHLYVDPHVAGARLFMHYGELVDGSRMAVLLSKIQPDEVYHLAAQSHVRVSFDEPEYTAETTGLGTIRLLEAIRQTGLECRFYQASSSEMFGSSPPPQNEDTPFHPRSPYGTSKVFAYWAARNYREAYGLFIVNGILFNHESPRRGGHSSRAKSPARSRASRQGWINTRGWATSTRCATGGMPGICRGHVADAAGRYPRGLRARHRHR